MAAAAATMAIAAGAPVSALDFIWIGQPAQVQALADELMDGVLHFVDLLLSIQEAFSNRVFQKGIPVLLELGDFLVGKGNRVLLLLLQFLALVHQVLILLTGRLIVQESIDALPRRLHSGLVKYGLAQFPCFLHHGGVFIYHW